MDSKITAVTVYTDRAQVVRRGEIRLEAGEQIITLPNLPATIDEDSVRVNGQGCKILSVEVKTEPGSSNIATLMAQLENLQYQDQALLDQEENYTSQIELLDAARDSGAQSFARKIANQRAAVDDLNRYARYIEDEQNRFRDARREAILKRKKLAREIDSMQKQIMIQYTSPISSQPTREVQILVSLDAPALCELETAYSVRNVSWKPYYDLRLVDDEVHLTYFAIINQSSGENWDSVDLTLSTAAGSSRSLPELTPQYVGSYAVPATTTTPSDIDYRKADKPASQVAQMTVEQGVALTYRVAAPVNIASDGAPHKAVVTLQKFGAKLDYLTIPKLAEEVHLRAVITNTSAFTLLPGVLSIFHGDEFVGKTSIDTIVPNEEFEIQLGVDDRIKVKRELVQRDVGKKFIGSTRQVQFAYKITLTNHSGASAKITVHDQIPLSQNERIQVKLSSATPAITEQDKLNLLKWALTLKPEEKQEISFAYMVEHPGDMNVSGLG